VVIGFLDRLSRPLMRALDPEDAHNLAIKALRFMPLPRPAPGLRLRPSEVLVETSGEQAMYQGGRIA